jgi:pimeloyl-ACP methyl ester carboxylesterase
MTSITEKKRRQPLASPAGGQSHFVSAGPNRIHYMTIGEGSRDIVLVHCWAGHLGFWREQIPALAQDARLILIDLPGHGRSDKPDTDYSLEFFAGAVFEVLRAAKVDRAIFIGHSMGATVLCPLYRRAPEKFAALVAVDGLLRRPHGTPAEAEALVGPFGTRQYLAHAKAFIRAFFPVPGTETLRDQVMAEMLATPQHVMHGAMLGMFGPAAPDWILQNVNAPVLAINARSPWWDDGYEPYVRSLSRQADYLVMEGAGHFLHLEKPAEFNTALTSRLRRLDLFAK